MKLLEAMPNVQHVEYEHDDLLLLDSERHDAIWNMLRTVMDFVSAFQLQSLTIEVFLRDEDIEDDRNAYLNGLRISYNIRDVERRLWMKPEERSLGDMRLAYVWEVEKGAFLKWSNTVIGKVRRVGR